VTSYHGYDTIVKGSWYYSTAVDCAGNEFSLQFCPYGSRNNFCSHAEDVWVHCAY
jgi:hypothetical protein